MQCTIICSICDYNFRFIQLTLVLSSVIQFYINHANVTIISSLQFHTWSYNYLYRVRNVKAVIIIIIITKFTIEETKKAPRESR